MQITPLRGRKNVEYVRRKGNVWRGKHMKVIYLHNKEETCQVGTAASTKLNKSAVKRNRMRRRCREALRTAVKEDQRNLSCKLILMPRSSSLECNVEEIKSDVKNLFDYLSGI